MTLRIEAQPGPQRDFQTTNADIAIYGGAAGGGKSWALLMEPLRHISTRDFGCVIFRRSNVQIRNEGGLWDESMKLYPHANGAPIEYNLFWKFPAGTSVSFGLLEYDQTVLEWQGSQICLIEFDELTHFSEYQFFYMLSRNRSTCGVKPYVRASTNPDPDSWVAKFIEWWIDQETGFPIPERSGVIRYMVRFGDQIIWADDPAELSHFKNPFDGASIQPKSVTFIPSKLSDNQILMATDPGYAGNLMALSTVERARLAGGNWKVRREGGMFKRAWFEVVDSPPAIAKRVRRWDLAATEAKPGIDPDWTVGLKMSRDPDGVVYIENVTRFRESSMSVERAIKNIASMDGKQTVIGLPQDPGQAGKSQVAYLTRQLAGHVVKSAPETGDKETRAMPLASQAEAGNVKIVRGGWNEAFFEEMEMFPHNGAHDDQVDAASGAFTLLSEPVSQRARMARTNHMAR